MTKNLIIAIDGYSSCGKSTLAKALAKKLGFIYVDSGAMYRAVTLYFIRNEINLHEPSSVANGLQAIELNFSARDYESNITLNGEEVSKEIRLMQVSSKVSEIAANKMVREEMVKQQQRMGQSANIVMDGRDIGTQVFPNAHIKLYMTADPNIRAERRFLEMKANGDTTSTLGEIFENLAQRDHADTTRVESPLVKADDATLLDNTELTQEEQLKFVLNIVNELRLEQKLTSAESVLY